MKRLIRKLALYKLPKEVFEGMRKHYLVVYRHDYDLLSEFELKELLLHPKKDKDIKFIFDWKDRLEVETNFEEEKEVMLSE